jgi:hypothetical protein
MATIKEAIYIQESDEPSLGELLLDAGVPNAMVHVVADAVNDYLHAQRVTMVSNVVAHLFAFLLPSFRPERNVFGRVLAMAWALGQGKATGHKSLVESAKAAEIAEQTMRDNISLATKVMGV